MSSCFLMVKLVKNYWGSRLALKEIRIELVQSISRKVVEYVWVLLELVGL